MMDAAGTNLKSPMAIVNSCLSSPNLAFLKTNFIPNPVCNNFLSSSLLVNGLISSKIQDFRLSSTASVSSCPYIDVDCPDSELKARGISFTSIGSSYVVKMTLKDGTTAKLLLPSGLITSFKPRMWHGGTMELLHTLVTGREGDAGGGALIQGGLSLALVCQNDGVSWYPDAWTLHRVSGTLRESIELELIGKNEGAGNVDHEMRHIISLGSDLLASEVVVCNAGTSPLTVMGSAICHLAVSTPEATYAMGLECSNFFARPPLVSEFSIIPPDLAKKTGQDPWKLGWPFNQLLSKRNASNSSVEDDVEGEEEDNYKHLTTKLSRVYTSAPRTLTVIDRGRRNSVAMRRDGFEEVYLFSPGSEHEWYAKYSYVSIGHAALLQPIIVNAQSEWRGVMQVFNPNT